MDFDFNQDQFMFQEATRGFLDANHGLDQVWAALDGDGFDAEFWQKLTDTGAFSMLVPEDHGGMGLNLVDLALVLEEYGRALVPSPAMETIGATEIIVHHANDDQKQRLLPQIALGQLRIVPAITEFEAGYAPQDTAMTARASGNGWSVSGRKVLVPHAAKADLLMVAMRFEVDGPLGLVLIAPDRQGVSLGQHSTLDLSGRFHVVEFDNVAFASDDIVGGAASPEAFDHLNDVGGWISACLMNGISAKVLDDCVAYVAQRVQFGKPIGSFQAIKHRCADMAVAIDSARSAAYYASWALAHDAPDREKAVSIAKSYCGDTARFVCNEGVQLHGGIGFTWELGLHFYLRRAKMLEYAYGDASYHRERVLQKALGDLERDAA